MEGVIKGYFLKLTKISLLTLLTFSVPVFFAGTEFLYALGLAYLLSYLFVASNFVALRKIDLKDHKKFYRFFLTSLAVRFLLMIAALIFVLEVIKIHQIFFTVSFIISYIFHSVIEIIFINHILETDS